MVYHDISFYDNVITHRSRTVVCHGVPWYTMVHIPWYTILYNGVPRYHCVCGCTMVYRGFHWYTMVPWYTMVTPWCTMVYHGKPW